MFVLEGTMSVLVGDKVEEIPAGGWHFTPRKIKHAFWNATDKPARFIDAYLGQNFDDLLVELFFKIITEMQKNNVSMADPGPVYIKRFAEMNKEFGLTPFDEERQPIVEKYGLKP